MLGWVLVSFHVRTQRTTIAKPTLSFSLSFCLSLSPPPLPPLPLPQPQALLRVVQIIFLNTITENRIIIISSSGSISRSGSIVVGNICSIHQQAQHPAHTRSRIIPPTSSPTPSSSSSTHCVCVCGTLAYVQAPLQNIRQRYGMGTMMCPSCNKQ